MMNYEIFKEVVAEKFLDYMPEEYRGCKVDIHPVTKVNQTMDALSLTPAKISPTMYLNCMYDQYLKSDDLDKTLRDAAETMKTAFDDAAGMKAMVNFESAKDNIIFVLVNTKQNEELLKTIPNRSFQDLSVIYRWVVNNDGDEMASSIVNDALAENLGMTEEDLFEAAVVNTKRLFPPVVRSMNEVIREMLIQDGIPEVMANKDIVL